VAAILDGIDGRVARLLRGTSRFGAELDSLSDVTAFGLAPALILYLWALQDIPRLGWVIALALAISCALRLARFNAQLDSEDLPNKRLGFLTGVPAPAGAGLALSPLLANLALDGALDAAPDLRSGLVATITLVTALLMVSSLPTWSTRSLAVPRAARLLVLAAIGLFAALLAQAPWAMLTAVALVYAGSIPLARARYRRLMRTERQGTGGDPARS
jgi:CDP-diacylglycerol--serine O-phosphatidyltransferase